jgi:hypothetical protein
MGVGLVGYSPPRSFKFLVINIGNINLHALDVYYVLDLTSSRAQ